MPVSRSAAATVAAFSPSGDPRGVFRVELALDPAARERGLMRRTGLVEGTGMLFVFPDEDERAFWMKDTLIPLDMLFADASGYIVSIARNVQSCAADPCPLVWSEHPAKFVLEVAGGALEALGIERGGRIELHDVPAARN
jgi:uncharacterized membrane protein (UPF0127 family)